MRRTPDQQAGCDFKLKHKTKGDALSQQNHGKGRTDDPTHRPLGAYRCTFCGYWHVGKSRHKRNDRLKHYGRDQRRQHKRMMVKLRYGQL